MVERSSITTLDEGDEPTARDVLLDAINALDRAAGFTTATVHLLSIAPPHDEIAESAAWTLTEVDKSCDQTRALLAKLQDLLP